MILTVVMWSGPQDFVIAGVNIIFRWSISQDLTFGGKYNGVVMCSTSTPRWRASELYVRLRRCGCFLRQTGADSQGCSDDQGKLVLTSNHGQLASVPVGRNGERSPSATGIYYFRKKSLSIIYMYRFIHRIHESRR